MFRGLVTLISLACLAACVDDRDADWNYVYTGIVRPSCATAACHSATTRQSGLDLSTRDRAYRALVGRRCGTTLPIVSDTGAHVDPGHPEASELMYWLRGSYNETMPPDSPLPAAEIDAVERWILDGAQCD
jgi:Planctomycete cytochrome C